MLHSQRSNRLLPAKLAAGQTYLHPDSIPYLHASTAARGAGGQHGHKYGLHNTRYRLERWVTPEGVRMLGRLSAEIGGVHFGCRFPSASVVTCTTIRHSRRWRCALS